jgi:hypothetical protein
MHRKERKLFTVKIATKVRLSNMSKTPQFDKELDAIFMDLVPHARICAACAKEFMVEPADIDFYKMLRVPPPTKCPLCRKKRRFGHLLRVPKFFKKKCSAPGHNEEVISVFPPASPQKIYDFVFYNSDQWGGEQFGVSYDPNELLFPQLKDLFFLVPHAPLERDPNSVNCDYTLGGKGGKNNYYCSMGYGTEDSSYSFDVRHCRGVIDCSIMSDSEACFGSVGSYNCSHCFFVFDCGECIDSSFLYECKNCSNCFLCSNLHNRSYVFNNEQLTKEKYNERIKSIDLGDRNILNGYLERFHDGIMKHALRRALRNVHTNDSIGDDLKECKRCDYVFRATKSENMRYADNLENARDGMDVLNMIGEKNYECVGSFEGGTDNRFSMFVRRSSFVEYCAECRNCNYCFACVGLRNKKFHIFNKLFEEEEYWKVIDGIKTKMLSDGEYGEFFELTLGLIPYQSSAGQLYFPLEDEEIQKSGIPWYAEPGSNIPKDMPLLKAPDEVESDIKNVDEGILDKAIVCEATGKLFRLIKSELEFYKKMSLPLPTRHPWQRLTDRTKFEHSLLLHPFMCQKCHEISFSVYSEQEQKELKIYCERCYLKEVI